MTHFVEHYGLWVVFGIVFFEVGGLPFIPGETALIAAAVLDSQGHGSIVATIGLAIAAAVLGATFGYAVGHRWGRDLLALWPWFERVSRRPVERSDEFFHRHGGKAVFIGRFLPVLRATLGWMAGVGRMDWWRFLAWNVAGGVTWGCAVGLAAYYGGRAAGNAIQRYGAFAGAGIAVAVVAGWLVLRFLERRAEE